MQFLYSGLVSGSIYAIVALGFNIIYSATGIVNFAQGEFVMLGGMFIFTFFMLLGFPFVVSFVIAVGLAFLLGVLFERSLIKYTRVKSEINLIAITIAGGIILREGAMEIWGRDTLKVNSYIPEKVFHLLGGSISSENAMIIGMCGFFVLLLSLYLNKTIYGKAMKASFNDKIASELVGVDVSFYRMMSFGVAAMLGAVSGIAVSPVIFVTYDDGIMIGLKGFAAAILGGFGSFYGVVLGGFILGLLESFGAMVLPSGYKDALSFLILILILFFKPDGLFGKKKVHRL